MSHWKRRFGVLPDRYQTTRQPAFEKSRIEKTCFSENLPLPLFAKEG
jgi:hypothetical protein